MAMTGTVIVLHTSDDYDRTKLTRGVFLHVKDDGAHIVPRHHHGKRTDDSSRGRF
ncbi:hypothetical protein M569_14938 [Genlisea aurea]|uniref:Uncharacterized protein n=1 Tax=Genlisea aurea TaxID=192259 RepID=S8DK83_9LAMI|nr:hypothetical protein M569_14938 [Genlisea aurea]